MSAGPSVGRLLRFAGGSHSRMKAFLIWIFTAKSSLEFPISWPARIEGPPALILTCVILFILSIRWAACDATRRGKSGFVAGVFVLIAGWPVSLLFWRWLRPPVSTPPPLPLG